jgi:hypothetical protein
MDRTEVRLAFPPGIPRSIPIASLAQFDGSSDLAEVIDTPYGTGRIAK